MTNSDIIYILFKRLVILWIRQLFFKKIELFLMCFKSILFMYLFIYLFILAEQLHAVP